MLLAGIIHVAERGRGEGRKAGREGSHLSKQQALVISHFSSTEKGLPSTTMGDSFYRQSGEMLLIPESIILKSNLCGDFIYCGKTQKRTAALKITVEPMPMPAASTKPQKQDCFPTHLRTLKPVRSGSFKIMF